MPRILILYATREGYTGKVAAFIAREIASLGFETDTLSVDRPPDDTALQACCGLIAGAPLHRGDYPRALRDFLARHHERLNTMTTAFFSVSLGAASGHEDERQEVVRLAESFVAGTGWRPGAIISFAGALRYSRYNLLVRWIMRRIVKAEGGDTDTRRDYEYTDWNAVRAFARGFCERLARGHGDTPA